MKPYWSLLDLDIIGFGSVLETPTMPRVLAPVFRHKSEPELVLLPPFTLVADEVFNANPSTASEVEDMVVEEKLTLLDNPIPAKVGHELWVDENRRVDYTPKVEARTAFETIFTTNLDLAEKNLVAGKFANACAHAAIARAVKPSHLDPLVIRGAAERLSEEYSQFAFTRHVATDYVSGEEFDRLVEARTGEDSIADSRGAAVMEGIAKKKPRLAAA